MIPVILELAVILDWTVEQEALQVILAPQEIQELPAIRELAVSQVILDLKVFQGTQEKVAIQALKVLRATLANLAIPVTKESQVIQEQQDSQVILALLARTVSLATRARQDLLAILERSELRVILGSKDCPGTQVSTEFRVILAPQVLPVILVLAGTVASQGTAVFPDILVSPTRLDIQEPLATPVSLVPESQVILA